MRVCSLLLVHTLNFLQTSSADRMSSSFVICPFALASACLCFKRLSAIPCNNKHAEMMMMNTTSAESKQPAGKQENREWRAAGASRTQPAFLFQAIYRKDHPKKYLLHYIK